MRTPRTLLRALIPALVCLVCARLPASTLPPAAPAASERKTAEFSGLTVEYPADDETFARDLALEYSHLPPPAASVSAPDDPLTLATLKARRADFLAAISRELHLRAPTPQMSAAYDQVTQIQEYAKLAQSTFQSSPRHIQIWHGSELRARLAAGDTIPGITRNPDGAGVTFHSPGTVEAIATWSFPVILTSRDTETGPALVRKKALEIHNGLAALDKILPPSMGFQLVLHETIERAIVENYLWSADRRWFCEGVANYLSYKVTAEILGPAAALRSYNLNTQLAQYPTLRATAHLEKWAALETQKKQNHDDRSTDQGRANYVFATEVIFKAAAANGPDFLPKLFAEIGRTPPEKATIKTVYRAYKKIFHGDLRDLLPNRS